MLRNHSDPKLEAMELIYLWFPFLLNIEEDIHE